MSLSEQLTLANQATSIVRTLSSKEKSELILAIAEHIENTRDSILLANEHEVKVALQEGMSESQIDRLKLNKDRVSSMVGAARQIANLTDPIGQVLESWKQESGIVIQKIRVPIGVVAVIYENRPNVTLDSAAISIMSGNVCVLRGSSAARQTNKVIVEKIHEVLDEHDLPRAIVTFIDDDSRAGATELMQASGQIDVLIPRGGPSLIEAVQKNATVPTIIDGAGNCHIYVDQDADLDLAEKLVINSKTQRPSVCNAAESLVVHTSVAKEFIPRIVRSLGLKNVELVGDQESVALSEGNIKQADQEEYGQEFLCLKLSVCVVKSLAEAISWVNEHATGHTEMIVTDNPETTQRFMQEITSAVVMQNTSTRFTDGQRFGFGAEIGISTQKLHARGPMALNELTTYQYRVSSKGSTV